MTEAEFLALPERERDALVAEKVFDDPTPTARIKIVGHLSAQTLFESCDPEPQSWFRDFDVSNDCWYWRPKHFTTTYEGMGLVIERMQQAGYWLSLKSPFRPGLDWHAGFTPHDMTGWNGRPDHEGSSDTAPLAVALAALKALGAVE